MNAGTGELLFIPLLYYYCDYFVYTILCIYPYFTGSFFFCSDHSCRRYSCYFFIATFILDGSVVKNWLILSDFSSFNLYCLSFFQSCLRITAVLSCHCNRNRFCNTFFATLSYCMNRNRCICNYFFAIYCFVCFYNVFVECSFFQTCINP